MNLESTTLTRVPVTAAELLLLLDSRPLPCSSWSWSYLGYLGSLESPVPVENWHPVYDVVLNEARVAGAPVVQAVLLCTVRDTAASS